MTELTAYIPDNRKSPPWLRYPPQLLDLIHNGAVDLTPWHILKGERALAVSETMASVFGRNLFAFAYCQYNDDFACFESGYSDLVKIINMGASRGYENEGEFSFGKWLAMVHTDMSDWQDDIA